MRAARQAGGGFQAARVYGRVCAAVISTGRTPRRRGVGLVIVAIGIAEELPLFTTDPDDCKGLDGLLTVVHVSSAQRPP